MMTKNILITDRFAAESLSWLERHPHLKIDRTDHPSKWPLDRVVGAHALLIRSRTPIDEGLLKRARQLQVIITATSGFDHIDLDACAKWGVTVMHTPTANVESAAQLTWALLLNLANRVQLSRPLIESGDWRRDQVIGMELSGRTHGIVGLGRIGSRVARLAQAFGMQVLAFDPYQSESHFEKTGVVRASLEELLRQSDSVSLHVPKTAETENMLTREMLSRIPRPLLLVNTSRGSVAREADLLFALRHRWLGGLGLDVFLDEPLDPASELLREPQVVLTPHIGANTEDAFIKASQSAAEKLVNFFLDGSTSETLPPRAPWYGATPLKAD